MLNKRDQRIAMDATEDLTTSHDLISLCKPEQWDAFEEAIKMMRPEDLEQIAERLECDKQEDWQDYTKAFANFEWYQFCEAFNHVMARPFEMDVAAGDEQAES